MIKSLIYSITFHSILVLLSFSYSWTISIIKSSFEFLLISFVLLIVVGPKDLPKVLRSIKSFITKIKSMASQFHSGIDDLANESEISNLRSEISKIENSSTYSSEIDEIKDVENEFVFLLLSQTKSTYSKIAR